MNNSRVTMEMELRHLSVNHRMHLVKLLEIDDSLLNLLMGNIGRNSNSSETVKKLRFNSSNIEAIREHSQRHKLSPIYVLLDEWSTMGRNRPKLKTLFDILVKCQLYQAADFIAELTQEEKPARPTSGPAAKVDISLNDDSVEDLVNRLNYPFSSIDITTKANRFNFVKPDNSPNLNDLISSNRCIKNENTVEKISTNQQGSDLIKFSSSLIKVSEGSENVTQESDLPALSGLMVSVDKDPNLCHMTNDIPDFSGLMKNNYYSDTDETQSVTESVMSSTI